MIAIVDCNNFYASCEKVFNPSLRGRPIIVLSNNDGCCVARSEEAKALGIKMGVPAFDIKEIIKNNNVAVFSSNYALYGDLSDRVMNIIASVIPEIEVYSIDESFLDVSSYPVNDLEKIAHQIRDKIRQWVGITVSVGIAPTKVLAKVANKIAKKKTGVVALIEPDQITAALLTFPVEDLWGIGGRYAAKLHAMSIRSAQDFLSLQDDWLKKNMTVNGLRISLELRGISCIPIEQVQQDRKAIGSAKSFCHPVTQLEELTEALSTYLASCALKLRTQGSAACIVNVFLQTNYFNKTDLQYSNSRTITLPVPSNLTPVLLKYAVHALKQIYRSGYKYKRVGILLSEFVPATTIQETLFDQVNQTKIHHAQETIDKLNKRFQRDQVRFASQGFTKRWQMKQERLSPRYTTRIDEIITAHI